MLETIVGHFEDGMRPVDAVRRDTGEIGFTIISISVSLIAVFIPPSTMRQLFVNAVSRIDTLSITQNGGINRAKQQGEGL
jgi:multidrug efflux pump subunit AcrB